MENMTVEEVSIQIPVYEVFKKKTKIGSDHTAGRVAPFINDPPPTRLPALSYFF